nr:AC091732_5 Putative polyprotein [Ipomoea batatas]
MGVVEATSGKMGVDGVEEVKDLDFDNAMDDLGASVSIMPSFVYDRLIFPPLTPTQLTVYLVDGSIQYPKGIVEDVLVRIKDCIILVDFVVLDVGNGILAYT